MRVDCEKRESINILVINVARINKTIYFSTRGEEEKTTCVIDHLLKSLNT